MRRWGAGAGAVAIALLASGCSAREALSLNAPDGATEQTPLIENLWFGAWVALTVVGVLTGGLILFAAVRFRRKDGDPDPKQTRYNVPLEVMYTIVPLVMIMGMFFFTVRDQTELTKVSDNPDNTVGVVGFRWSWAFNYVEDDVYDVGTAEVEDMPTLYLPVNESVVFELQSPDVIHSFWIPAFLMKMDVFPGRLNKFEVTPEQGRHLRRAVCRVVRCRPLPDAVHREGRGARRVRPAHGRAQGQGPDRFHRDRSHLP